MINFVSENEELCIKNDEFCIKNAELCSENKDDLEKGAFLLMTFYYKRRFYANKMVILCLKGAREAERGSQLMDQQVRMMDFVLKTRNIVSKTRNFVFKNKEFCIKNDGSAARAVGGRSIRG